MQSFPYDPFDSLHDPRAAAAVNVPPTPQEGHSSGPDGHPRPVSGEKGVVIMCLPNCDSGDRPPDVICLSLYVEGSKEALTHKWLVGEFEHSDPGDRAILEWAQKHWNHFLRARWLDHLFGRVYFVELESDDFGLLDRHFRDSDVLPLILEKLAAGEENLHIINHFHAHNLPVDPMLEILSALDVNSIRLQFKLVHRLSPHEPGADSCPCRMAG